MDSNEYLRRMKRCSLEELDFKILLDEFTYSIIFDIHNSSNLPLPYIFLSVVVAMCHWTNGSHLKGVNFYQIPLILFGIIRGGSGTKKSGPIRLIKEACEQVESFVGIPIAKSSLNNSATMESVCLELQNRPHLLQVWDELAIFLGLFGSNRSERASYDRGIMCELYNPTGIVRRQLVSRTNIMVKPRLSILAAGHPRETINCLTGAGTKAMESNDDGLFNRFLISVGFKRKPSRDCPSPDNKLPKLVHLFYYTQQLHHQQQEYTFNQEAYVFMKDTVHAYDYESVNLTNEDDFLASNITKAIEHIQRLATILHILKVVSRRNFNLACRRGTFGSLDENFRNLVAANALTEIDRIIEYETCFNAKRMMDYFLSVKKILAGYDPINNKILTDRNDAKIDGIPSSEIDHIKSYIRNHPSDRILLTTLPSNLKRKYSKEQFLPILQQLETDGHGKVTTTDNTTGPKAIVFVKKPRVSTAAQPVTTAASTSTTVRVQATRSTAQEATSTSPTITTPAGPVGTASLITTSSIAEALEGEANSITVSSVAQAPAEAPRSVTTPGAPEAAGSSITDSLDISITTIEQMNS